MVTFLHMITFHQYIMWLLLKGPDGQWGSRQEGVQKYLGNHNCFRWWVIKSYLENVAYSGFSCTLSLFDKYFNVNNMMKMHHMMDFHPIKCLEFSLFHWLSKAQFSIDISIMVHTRHGPVRYVSQSLIKERDRRKQGTRELYTTEAGKTRQERGSYRCCMNF